MNEIYVNEIIEQDGVTVGLAVLDSTVQENLLLLYSLNELNGIMHDISQHPEGAYFITRFCQFVVLVQVNEYGWSLKVSDYHNNIDIALDEYSDLSKMGWSQRDRDKIMTIFQEIEKDTPNTAKMVIKDAFSG